MRTRLAVNTRRGFLRSSLGACWTGAALLEQAIFRATQARAQAVGDIPSLFNIQRVAPGVYAAVAKPLTVINCNAAIFENEKDLLIVDSHSKPSAVVALVAQLKREVTPKPVRYVVNSHFHWDHTQGNGAYRKIQPDARLVASSATRLLLSENGAQRLKQSVEEMRTNLAMIEDRAGKSQDAAAVRRLKGEAQEIRNYIAEMNDYKPELPDITFDHELVIHDKAHDLHLMFRGRAHTLGDVVVFCPQKRVVATGDMIHSWLPFIADGFPREWPKTMRSVAELQFDHLIGGHGEVQQGKGHLNAMASYIEEITESVARGSGKSVAELQASIRPEALKSLSGEYGDFLRRNLAGGNAALIEGVRTNLADVAKRLNAV